jgi:hypothetical protein
LLRPDNQASLVVVPDLHSATTTAFSPDESGVASAFFNEEVGRDKKHSD